MDSLPICLSSILGIVAFVHQYCILIIFCCRISGIKDSSQLLKKKTMQPVCFFFFLFFFLSCQLWQDSVRGAGALMGMRTGGDKEIGLNVPSLLSLAPPLLITAYLLFLFSSSCLLLSLVVILHHYLTWQPCPFFDPYHCSLFG